MKKSLPIAVYLLAFLCSSTNYLHAQSKAVPVLQAIAAVQHVPSKRSGISQDLQKLFDRKRMNAGSMRTEATESYPLPMSAADKFIVTRKDKVLVNITLKQGSSKASKAALAAMGLEITATYGRM